MTNKVNPSLTTFNNMQWRPSNEYTHNDDKFQKDRVHLHSEVKSKKLDSYKNENPKFENVANRSRFMMNRKLFDGSKISLV